MNPIVQILKEKNIIKNNLPVIQTINSFGFNDIEELGEQIEEVIRSANNPTHENKVRHTASSDLSGGVNSCSSLECRSD